MGAPSSVDGKECTAAGQVLLVSERAPASAIPEMKSFLISQSSLPRFLCVLVLSLFFTLPLSFSLFYVLPFLTTSNNVFSL